MEMNLNNVKNVIINLHKIVEGMKVIGSGNHDDINRLEYNINILKAWADIKEDDLKTPNYEYEMKVEEDWWFPIETTYIDEPNRIEEYLEKGILRKIENNGKN